MRESRSSGSVEGVVGNHDSYSDFFPTINRGAFCIRGKPRKGASEKSMGEPGFGGRLSVSGRINLHVSINPEPK